MKYLIGIFLVFLSSASAQDCQSAVTDTTKKEGQKGVERYTYNATEMKCVRYFEVDPNVVANSFESSDECRGNCSWKPGRDCKSPKDNGPCRKDHKRFYYNTTSSTCEEFTYGGCQGNSNNYKSLDACVASCVPQPNDCQSAVTKQEEHKGVARYTYNAAELKCVRYFEGDPNVRANSFFSETDCKKQCSFEPYVDCTSPKNSGTCHENYKRFYYDTASSTCQEFTYSGCQGNPNNYEALDMCVFFCVPQPNDCQSAVTKSWKGVKRYTYNAAEMKCDRYLEGDQNVRVNSYMSKYKCEKECSLKPGRDCTSPKDSGPCRKDHKRFYYNTTSSTCQEFTYGGCKGNSNNYKSLDACVAICVPQPNDCQSAVTKKEEHSGVERYTYNATEMKCVRYFEGDPNVRANSFFSETECAEQCSRKIKVDCTSPKDSGPCRKAHKSFYYNTASSTCEEFAYGGCQGNGNNFEYLAYCKYFCHPPFCHHPKVVGNCSESHKRYFYDIRKAECKEFVYSGCGGNTNNFETLELCIKECKAV